MSTSEVSAHDVILQDFSVVIIAAAVVTILFRQFKLPVVLGYITAGFLIGPHFVLKFLQDQETLKGLSELGIIALMFCLGLEFSLRKLKSVGATAVIGAVMEVVLMGWLGYHFGKLFGWENNDALFLGAMLAMSSTTIIIKALDEMGLTRERFAELVFGILIIEDIIGILILALISGYNATGSLAPGEVGLTFIQLTSFLGVVLIFGLMLVPRFLDYVARFRSNEMLLMAVIGLCFAISLLAYLLEFSVALGAFLIGAVIAEARQIVKIETLMNPVRDVFSAIFFVYIGTLISPADIVQYWGPILAITALVVIGKVIACALGTFIAGNDIKTSMRTGMTLAQIGEFSFIIAALGLNYGLASPFIYPVAVAVSAITTLLTPFLIKLADPLSAALERHLPDGVRRTLNNYSNWVAALSNRKGNNLGASLLKKWGWQIGLNVLLITAVFVGAAALRGTAHPHWPNPPGGEEGLKGMLWAGAMLLSLPMFIAIFRKLQAAGMLIAEMTITRSSYGQKATGPLRGLVSTIVVALGTSALGLLVLVLSSAVLPSGKLLVVLGVGLVVAVIMLRRTFVKVYAKAQIALIETFEAPPVPRHEEEKKLPPMLHEAELLTIKLPETAWTVGKLISEIKLRTKTGASIVGIERDGKNIINPRAEEELRAGDQVVILGTKEQLSESEKFILATDEQVV